MSLLLDALKRAEQEKLARGPATEPPPPPARERPPAPTNSLELQPLGTAPATMPLGGTRAESSQHAAQTVFQAKTAANEPRSRGMVWATIGATVVVVIAAGAYVWYSINSLTPKQASFTPRQRPAPLPPAAAGSVPPQQAPVDAPPASFAANSTRGFTPSPVPAAASVSTSAAAPSPAPPATPAPAPAPARVAAAPREDAAEQLLRDSGAQPPPLRMDRSTQAPRRVPAEISAGYDALRQGDLAAARRGYGSAMAADPLNLDAQLGLATVEARAGNRTTAAMHYRKVLEADPRNSTALAGLAALADFTRPDAVEGRLRADVALNPESAPLHFTLGNVYAAQHRWNEAQMEYFEAHRLEPGSADIAFNLAVSLDNLGQPKLAAAYYARALDAGRTQAGQFDPAVAARRLAEIR